MRTKSLILAAVLCSTSALADTMTFSPGALIIPEQSNFQTGCGAVSAYGLVWRILQSNQPGHYNANHPVTVYWLVSSTKKSPNRCIPTNLSIPPGSLPLDPRWKDGCDAAVTAVLGQPVTLVDFSGAWPVSGIFPDVTVPMYTPASGDAQPVYTAVATPLSTTGSPLWNTISYMGGPFAIDASDAQNVFNFLKLGDPTVGVPATATQQFYSGVGSCGAGAADPNYHVVNIHQAKVGFSAEVGKRMNKTPPKLALLDFNSDGSDVATNILVDYLKNAGLWVATGGPYDSAGCPAGTLNSSCGDNGGAPGLIYDRFDTPLDLMSTSTNNYGLLNHTTLGKLDYKVFWTPHWLADKIACGTTHDGGYPYGAQCNAVGGVFDNYNPDGVSASIRDNVLRNIAHFADQRGTGLMAECASLETYEMSWNTSGGTQSPKETDGGPIEVTGTHFMFSNGIYENGLGTPWNGKNCTDPDYNGTSACTIYPNPNNIFAQAGDFFYNSTNGHVHEFKPFYGVTRNSDYKPGVQVLATSWKSNWSLSQWPVGTAGAFPTNSASAPCDPLNDNTGGGYCTSGFDFFSMGYKDNSTQKATIVYIAGHKYDQEVVGNRVILNTLFALGADPFSQGRSASVPIGFVNDAGSPTVGTGTRDLEFTAIYDSVSGYPPGVQTYSPSNGSAFVFPYFPGDVTVHSVGANAGALANGENDLTGAITNDGTYAWDAQLQLTSPAAISPIQKPGDRNIFTYFGGYVSDDTAIAAVNRAPSKVLQIGWTPEAVDGTTSNSVHAGIGINSSYASPPNTGCTDVVQLGDIPGPNHHGTDPDKGLIPGSDGICDLQEAAGAPSAVDPHNGANPANLAAYLVDFPNTQQLLQRVRGYCYANSTHTDGDSAATPVLTPNELASPSDCNNPDDPNRPNLGGFVYSAPAIVPYSANIKDLPLLPQPAHRPTVAYSSGYDGMLHAFYVSGGAGYTGPQGAGTYPGATLHFLHQSPANGMGLPGYNGAAAVPAKFNTPWLSTSTEPSVSGFTPPPPMTELWAFMPASQLPSLRNNNTKVDSSPVVQDVFADFGFTGTPEWHTVLSGSVGSAVNGTYSEVYALDITNPLKPVILWDLVGAWDTGGAEPTGTFPAFMLSNDSSPGAPGYTNTYGVGSVFHWDGKNADFEENPAIPDPGRTLTPLYNYREMGAAQALTMLSFTPPSAVPPRVSGGSLAAVFVNTNAGPNDSNNDGQNVYGIEVTTGQQVWHWSLKEHDGDDDFGHHHGHTGNSVPPGASLYFDDVGGNFALLVGDQLGRVWSLDPGTGESNYVMATNTDKHGHHHGCGGHGPGHGCGCPALISDSADNDPQPVTTLVAAARVPPGASGAFAGHDGEEVIVFGTGAEPWAYTGLPPATYPIGRLHVGLAGTLANPARVCDDTARSVTGVMREPSGFPQNFNPVSFGTPPQTYGQTINGDISVSGSLVSFGAVTSPLSDLFGDISKVSGRFYVLNLAGTCVSTVLDCSVLPPGNPIGAWGTFNRGTYGGGATFISDKVTGVGELIGTQTSKIDRITLGTGSGAATGVGAPSSSLSVNGTGIGKNGAKGVIEWVKRRLR